MKTPNLPNQHDQKMQPEETKSWLANSFGLLAGALKGAHGEDHFELVYDKIILRPPQLSDYNEWRELREKSRSHITRWEPDWQESEISLEAFKKRLQGDLFQRRAKRGFSFYIFKSQEGAQHQNPQQFLVGGIGLSDIRKGNRQSGHLGYWVGQDYTCQGYGSAGVAAVKDFAFHKLGLHRIEAACQPGNIESIKLLQKSGFVQEGLALKYLKINGEWRDHQLWACCKTVKDA